AGLTYVITHSAIKWVPAWWFPFLLVGLGTGTVSYLARGVRQPAKALVIMAMLFSAAAVIFMVSGAAGYWDFDKSPISSFWTMGHVTDDSFWLLWFMTATSVVYILPIVTHNWPFTKIPMPWGGFIACAFY